MYIPNHIMLYPVLDFVENDTLIALTQKALTSCIKISDLYIECKELLKECASKIKILETQVDAWQNESIKYKDLYDGCLKSGEYYRVLAEERYKTIDELNNKINGLNNELNIANRRLRTHRRIFRGVALVFLSSAIYGIIVGGFK